MNISPRNEVDLTWFFTAADSGRSASTFGMALDRQASRYQDSEGRPIPLPGDYNYMSVKEDQKDAKKTDPSYTMDHSTTLRIASISRKLQQLPLQYQNALAMYYGHQGYRWEMLVGRGRRCCCLIPLLPEGKRWFAPLYAKYGSITLESILMCELEAQQKTPNDIRDRQLYKLETAAYELRLDAEAAYQIAVG